MSHSLTAPESAQATHANKHLSILNGLSFPHVLALTLIACSVATNGSAASQSAHGLMAAVSVAIVCCSDLLKSSLLPAASKLYSQGRRAVAAAALLLLVIALAVSSTMALSGALGSRLEASGDRQATESARARWQSVLDATAAELKGLPPMKPVGELQALVDSGDGVDAATWLRTARCRDVTRPASQLGCKSFFDNRTALGAASSKQEIEATMKAAAAGLAALPPVQVADATVTAVQRVLALGGWTVEPATVQTVAAVSLVLLLELGSVLAWTVADALSGTDKEAQGRPEAAQGVSPALDTSSPAHGQLCGQAEGLLAAEATRMTTTGASGPQNGAGKPIQLMVDHKSTAGNHGQPMVNRGYLAGNRLTTGDLTAFLGRTGGLFEGGYEQLGDVLGVGRECARKLALAAKREKLLTVDSRPGRGTVLRLRAQLRVVA